MSMFATVRVAASAARTSQKRLPHAATSANVLLRSAISGPACPASIPHTLLSRFATSTRHHQSGPVIDQRPGRPHAAYEDAVALGRQGSASSSTAEGHHEGPSISVDDAEAKIEITWSSGLRSRYHNIWLRDHCRCPRCYHQQTKQRQLDTFGISSHIKPLTVDATTEGLAVQWPQSQVDYEGHPGSDTPESTGQHLTSSAEGHVSLYPWEWLYANSYSPVISSGSGRPLEEGNLILWGRGIAQQPPTVTWDEVMNGDDDRGLARWLAKISQFGFCFVTGMPPTPEDTEKLVKRIAFIRETHYGGFWDFTSDLSHGDTAYTNLALGAHTDTTYFTDPAGLQIFHLLSHTESQKGDVHTPAKGGESLLVDGFFAAKILREVHPDAYKTLARVAVSTHSAGDEDTLIRPLQRAGYPILEHDVQTGELIRVRYNNDDRSVLRVSEDDVLPFYDALGKWHRILTHKDSEYWSQLRPGTSVIFDNHRVLHGRSAFTGQRRLCGAYVNHDDFRSRTAILLKRHPDIVGPLRKATSPNAEAEASAGAGKALNGAHPLRRGVWDDGI